ncbi:hypothetical protein PRIPAC_72608 [Pristionchus pacificus]|uniref:Uncharacterized protein n=1 Tax=Pristionchus pacificus TaxID=54126 RepID=A0A2A6C535_PRIPA|nr:hypothetical protein PRIPAC_72608 [Pristionchus pacificus]|eukprot:PDM73227.1 hypothetical protein PRIPAC_40583 [Pristionchus pacificus]
MEGSGREWDVTVVDGLEALDNFHVLVTDETIRLCIVSVFEIREEMGEILSERNADECQSKNAKEEGKCPGRGGEEPSSSSARDRRVEFEIRVAVSSFHTLSRHSDR